MTATWIDGVPTDRLPADDRGLAYGDGLFETMAVVGGRVRALPRHLERLTRGAARLGFPALDRAGLAAELEAAAARFERGVLKLVVTRGSGPRGYRLPEPTRPRRILSLGPWPAWATEAADGIAVRICETRLAINPALAGMKHLNRLEQVLARREWSDPAIAEGLMLDVEGAVVCGTMTNLMAVAADGAIVTPRVDRCGVAGVMRSALLDAARGFGLAVHETRLELSALRTMREVMLCNAVIGVWPVRQLGDMTFPAGPVAGRFRRHVDAAGAAL